MCSNNVCVCVFFFSIFFLCFALSSIFGKQWKILVVCLGDIVLMMDAQYDNY